jgi:hypothetical protein
MKEQIQALVAQGRTEDALKLLATVNQDAILLQARFKAAQKQNNMGLIDFSEWSRVQNQINFALLDLAGNAQSSPTNDGESGTSNPPQTASTSASNASNTPKNSKKVFISYNHKDAEMSQAVKNFLEENGCDVTIDVEDMKAGESIQSFIQDKIKENHYILSLVSQNSLKSGWVGKESTAAFFATWLADKQFIPVDLDGAFQDEMFYLNTVREINKKVKEKRAIVAELEAEGADPRPLNTEIYRLNDLKNNLGQIIENLKGVLTVKIDAANFEDGMKKVMKKIV